MARTFLLEASLSGQFWVNAAYAATYTINILPIPLLDHSSLFERLFQTKPNYSFLRVFGCECFPTFLPSPNKLEPCSKQCVFICYTPDYKGCRCLDPTTGCVYVSCHVLLHENVFPCLNLTSSSSHTSPLELVVTSHIPPLTLPSCPPPTDSSLSIHGQQPPGIPPPYLPHLISVAQAPRLPLPIAFHLFLPPVVPLLTSHLAQILPHSPP